MKKYLLPLFLSACPLFAQNTSNDNQPSKTPSNKQTTDQQEPDLYRKDVEVVSFHTEFLYWAVRENAMDYALEMQRPAWGPSDSYAQGRYKTANFNYDPGFRVALSYYNAPKDWEMWAQYTWLHSEGNNSAHKPSKSEVFLDSTWPQIFKDPLQSAHSHVKLHYNLADGLFTRVFIPNPHLRLRLVGGLTGTWMDQDWTIKYSGGGKNQTSIQNNWDFWGAGFRGGTAVDWFLAFLGNDFYLTAKASAAVLLGRYHNHAFQKTTFDFHGKDDSTVPIRDAYYKDTRCAYTVQFLVGPSWQKNFTSARVEVFAGYEITSWINIHEVFRSTGSDPSGSKQTLINSGAMSLDGLTVRLTVDF